MEEWVSSEKRTPEYSKSHTDCGATFGYQLRQQHAEASISEVTLFIRSFIRTCILQHEFLS